MHKLKTFSISLISLALLSPLAFAHASVSVSIQSLSPSTNISIGTTVSFTVSTSGFTNPSFSLSDSFANGSASNSNINSSGNFSWTPNQNDIGTHNFTISISDSYSNNTTVQEQITVSALSSISVQSLSPSSTVNTGQTVSFTVASSGFTNPAYTLIDPFNGTTVSSSNINSSGYFAWTPAAQDVGNHNITVTVTDSYGHSATVSESLTVNSTTATVQGSGVIIQGLSPGSTVITESPVTFTTYASGFTNPLYTISDSFGGSTISNSAINSSSGYFNWTPVNNDIGTHNITIWATDTYGHSASVVQQLIVQGPNLTISSINPSTSIGAGTPITFTVTPAGLTNPSYAVSDNYSGTTIANSDISSSGYFTWTPATAETGTHAITVYATDSYGHSANTSVTIYVNPTTLTLTIPSSGSSVAPGSAITFSASTYGFTNPTFSITDSFQGTSITNSSINYYGNFSWVPKTTDIGAHSIIISAIDAYGHRASATAQIAVATAHSNIDALTSQLQILENELAELQAGQSVKAAAGQYKFLKPLSLGSKGADVTALQKRLTAEGIYKGPITGYYGLATKTAVKKYQAKHGLSQLGNIGPGTRALLNR